MRWDHIVRGGTIVAPEGMHMADIYIKNGKITAIASERLPGEAREETDARGLHLLPGVIDIHVHSRDRGATHKEDFAHSTRAAAAGGVTTLFEMPNTNPPVYHAESFLDQARYLEQKAFVDFALWGICLGEPNRKHLDSLAEAGAIAFKFFWGYAIRQHTYQLVYQADGSDPDIIPPMGDGEVFGLFEQVARTGKVLAIHAENYDLIQTMTRQVKAGAARDYDAMLRARPGLAEKLTIQTAIAFAKETGARLHILHMSTGDGVDLVREAQKEGIAVTAETCPHYLFLCDEDYERLGSEMKVYPLIKRKRDQEKLWQGIEDGTISIVCSDHAPHTEVEKTGDIWSIPSGICGVETLLPLMLQGVHEGRITLPRLAALLSENPARQFGLYPRKGKLQIGSDADITIVDLKRQSVIRREELHSKSKVTAFDGMPVNGLPVKVILGGRTVMENGALIGDPGGKLVNPLG
ncbi:allantoinase [Paenibacillus sp. MY03]|uniref:allantoinase AllB n=1 Tax=Paenibacillus sp. MY03 TaxID=302980 RepID=UPI000B3C934A|nr:allantoinase AllB [Paenibacillus sp. MY03]OUS78710.1 allantoinase [Paenibacillus sp. MY03]